MKVSLGIVACERLFYLKSCLLSFLHSVGSEHDVQVVVVDNASKEPGTDAFLDTLRDKGVDVVKQPMRRPNDEFAIGLNTIVERTDGDIIIMIQGDMQFVLSEGWLSDVVDLFEHHSDRIGCLCLDAQRAVRLAQGMFDQAVGRGLRFVADGNRNPINGAADCVFSRRVIETIQPWNTQNEAHEGAARNSETLMLDRVRSLMKSGALSSDIACYVPIIPPAVAIYNEDGTNARVRDDVRIGHYFSPKLDEFRYYDVISYEEQVKRHSGRSIPVPIEEMARPLGWQPLLEEGGGWAKRPLRLGSLVEGQYTKLYDEV